MKRYFLGIDMGGTTVKAAVFDEKGREYSVVDTTTKLITASPGFTERDMEEFYDKVCFVIRQAVEKAKISAENIAGISCTGHGKGLYLWGKDNKPARNGIISTDTRAAQIMTNWQKDGTEKSIFPHTYQTLHVSQPCCLLRWVRDNEPDVYKNIKWVFEAKDYMRFRLTGKAYAEITDYSGTNLMNLEDKNFERELFDKFDISEMYDCMPPVCGSFDICGGITQKAAAITGLAVGTPVIAGMFDIDACALAMDILDDRYFCAIAGTWGINEYISKAPILDGTVARNSIYCIPEYYLIEESSPTSAGNLEWIVNNIFDCDRADAKAQGKSIYKIFDEMVEAVLPQKCDTYYLPFIFGGNENPLAKGVIAGMEASAGKAHILRAVFEGIVYCHKMHINKLLQSRSGKKPIAVRLGGGAAKSTVWVQMFADILNLPIEVVTVQELGTLGCAINVAVATGCFDSVEQAVTNMSSKSNIVYPNKETVDIYVNKFEKYIQLCAKMDSFWCENVEIN